jgi:phosphotriesterase-related protein
MVNTVLGEISPDELGMTLMHEHVIYGYAGWYADATMSPFDRENLVKTAVKTMGELKNYGLKTYVDATPNDSGRDPELLKEISEKSGMNIICSTGLYTEAEGAAAYFKFRNNITDGTKEIYELYKKEITEGIGNTGVKAGVIKVATGLGAITGYEKMVLRAAARTQKETGVPIITHTEAGTMGPEQAGLLISEGADPRHIMIGHSGGSADLGYHTSILDNGVYLAFDRMGLDAPLWHAGPDKLRLGCIIGLIGMGYADKLMLSHDYVIRWLGRPTLPLLPEEYVENWHPIHISKDIIPAFKRAGVTDEQIDTIMVENPRRIFGGR